MTSINKNHRPIKKTSIRLTDEKHEKLIKNPRELNIWKNFYESINSDASKYGYTNSLWVYMEFDGVTKYSQLIDRPIDKIKTSIRNYLMSLKSRNLSTSYIRYTKAAIKHFYDMNEIENLL